MVVYFGHAIRNVSNADEEKCLLRNPSKSWVLVSDATLEGCYFYFDTDSGNWIRSGKAVGSNQSTPRAGLLNRGRGHIEAAKKSDAIENNKFYNLFPTADNPNRMKNAGYFEDLQQFVGMGFDRDKETEGLTSSTTDAGIFFGLEMYWKRSSV